ncbi:MAG: response regulator [Hormoscilla sp.]
MVANSRELETLNELFAGLESEEELRFSPEKHVIKEEEISISNKIESSFPSKERRLTREVLSSEELEITAKDIEELERVGELDISNIQLTTEDGKLPSQKGQNAEGAWENYGEMTADPKNAPFRKNLQGKNPNSKKQKSEKSGYKLGAEPVATQSQTLAEAESEDFDDLLAIGGTDNDQSENWDVLEPLESYSSQSQEINDLELELETLETPEDWSDFQMSESESEDDSTLMPEGSLEAKEMLSMEDLDLGDYSESALSELELEMSAAPATGMELEELSLDSLEELSAETEPDTLHFQGEEPSRESGAQAEMLSMADLDLGDSSESMLSELELEMESAPATGMELEELSLDSLEELSAETEPDTSIDSEELDMDLFSEYGQESEEVDEATFDSIQIETENHTVPEKSELLQDIDLGEDSDLMWDWEESEAAGESEMPPDMDGNLLGSGQSTDDIEAMLYDFSDTAMDATEELADDFDFDSIDLDLERELLGDRTTSPKNVTAAMTSALDSDVLDWDLLGDIGVDLIGEQTDDISLTVADAETVSEGQTPPWEELEALLGYEEPASLGDTEKVVFDRLEEFLNASPESPQAESVGDSDTESDVSGTVGTKSSSKNDDFDELQALLEDADKLGGPSIKSSSIQRPQQMNSRPRPIEQNMKVPIKQLDNLSNLVGELVVNRNSLEQDQDRLRTTLDNLLYQVQQLNDVGGRMQDLYERSLLEASLLSSRASNRGGPGSKGTVSNNQHHPGEEFDPDELDSFTAFHELSQEMIELIVRVRESASDIEFIVDETDQVTRQFRQVTTQLQEGLTRTRMIPFAQTVDKLPPAVKRVCMQLNKQAQIQIEGRETLIDKMIQEHLSGPMTHLINNAMTHGVESPEVRETMGKPPVGQITVRAFHQGNQTVISVSDDGAGIDAERVKNKGIEKGLISQEEAKTISRLDLYDLLFHPGFSTKDQVDDLAGRGVGLDVVRTSLRDIRGAINIDSTLGKGTTFTIRLPLTLSISKALCCISNWARIAFPMDGVEDMLDVPKERISVNSEGQSCIMWRDIQLPFRPLSELLQYNRQIGRARVFGANEEEDIVSIVVLRGAGEYIALQVDQVLGEQEIVIKQLEGPVPKPMGVAGATVLGDSRIMPIADVLELIDLSKGRSPRRGTWDYDATENISEPPQLKTETTVLIVDDSITVRELLSMTFNKAGYRVEQARDGQDAWDKLRSGLACDIIFCDMEMPRMNGLELLERLQKDEHLDRIPMAMLTSRGADKYKEKAANLGAKGYFTKPYLEEALLEAAQQMLKGEVLMSAAS